MNPPKGKKIRFIGAIFLALLLLLGAAAAQAASSQPLGDVGQRGEGVGYAPESEGVDYTQPLFIGIKAQRRRVPRGKTAVLTVWVSPVPGAKANPSNSCVTATKTGPVSSARLHGPLPPPRPPRHHLHCRRLRRDGILRRRIAPPKDPHRRPPLAADRRLLRSFHLQAPGPRHPVARDANQRRGATRNAVRNQGVFPESKSAQANLPRLARGELDLGHARTKTKRGRTRAGPGGDADALTATSALPTAARSDFDRHRQGVGEHDVGLQRGRLRELSPARLANRRGSRIRGPPARYSPASISLRKLVPAISGGRREGRFDRPLGDLDRG